MSFLQFIQPQSARISASRANCKAFKQRLIGEAERVSRLTLKLFISGRSVRSDTALNNLYSALSDHPPETIDLDIIDVLENPQLAEDEFVLATPTLIKTAPLPVLRTIGDLSDKVSLLRGLGLIGEQSIEG